MSTKTVSGTVQRVNKNGRFYSICVDDEWFGTGSTRPDADEGSMVEFEAERNGKYWNADMSTFSVLDAPKKAKKFENKKASYSSSGRSESFSGKEDYAAKQDYWKNKEERDIKNDLLRNVGAGRNTAIAFVELLMKADAIKLPATQNKKADALFEAVEYYRVKFENAGNEETSPDPSTSVEEESEDEAYDEDE